MPATELRRALHACPRADYRNRTPRKKRERPRKYSRLMAALASCDGLRPPVATPRQARWEGLDQRPHQKWSFCGATMFFYALTMRKPTHRRALAARSGYGRSDYLTDPSHTTRHAGRPARQRLLSGSCPSARSFAPCFLPTLSHPRAVALRFVRCDQLTAGLAPARVRPCRAHQKKAQPRRVALRFHQRRRFWRMCADTCRRCPTQSHSLRTSVDLQAFSVAMQYKRLIFCLT